MMRRAPPKAPTGMPPPITLPKVARSGAMPKSSAAPPRASRNPEITSSKMRSAPYSLVSRHRLDDEGRDARALTLKQLLQRRFIIERQHARAGRERLGHAGGGRAAKR